MIKIRCSHAINVLILDMDNFTPPPLLPYFTACNRYSFVSKFPLQFLVIYFLKKIRNKTMRPDNICIYIILRKTKTTYAYKALASIISYWRQEFVLFIIVSIAINVRPFVVKKLYDRTEVNRVSFNMRYSLSYLFTSPFCLRVKNLSLTYKFHLLSVSCSMRFGTEYNSYSMQHV